MPRTLDQKRAAYCLKHLHPMNVSEIKEYCDIVKAFPAQVLINGLGQALAMLLAKGGESERLYRHIETWLCSSELGTAYNRPLIKAIMNHGQDAYIQAQGETQALVNWMKKLALAQHTILLAKQKETEQGTEDENNE